jgi:hypothetical protein
MKEKSHIINDLKKMKSSLPYDYSEFFMDFMPWQDDMKPWRTLHKENLEESKNFPVIRTKWGIPNILNEKVLIDITECLSESEAIATLIDVLRWNQLTHLVEHNLDKDQIAFCHPDDVPPAIFYAHANLVVSIASFGKEPVKVIHIANNINKRLNDSPSLKQKDISLKVTLKVKEVKEKEFNLEYSLPYVCGEEGYLKFIVKGGILSKRNGKLFIKVIKKGKMKIEAYQLESVRKPYYGQLYFEVK